jgi:hypothetical protein
MMSQIKYRNGMKYQLVEESVQKLRFCPPSEVRTEFVIFEADGTMRNPAGYAWDGPSGPTRDDETNMRGSLVHDSGYQLMRMGLLPESFRDLFDAEFKHMCIEDGMSALRAEMYFEGVHLFGKKYAMKQEEHIITAP